jgi:TolA-binding protein
VAHANSPADRRRRCPWPSVALAIVPLLVSAPAGAQDKDPNQPDAAAKKLMAASGLFAHQMYELAAREYTEFLKEHAKHPEAASARYGLAICHYRLGRHADAAKELATVLTDAKFAKRDEALAVLGYCHLVAKDHAKALAAFEEVLSRHPKSRQAEYAAASRLQALHLLGRHAPAAEACKAFLKKYPDSGYRAAAMYYQALSRSALEEHAAGEKILQDLLKKHPNGPYDVDAKLLLAQAQERQGKLEAAAEQLRQLAKSAPAGRQAEARYSLGLVLYKMEQFDEAAKAHAAVLSKHPDSECAAPARFQLGVAQVAAGRIAEARKTLERVAAGDKARANNARYWLARCDLAEKKYEQAQRALKALAAVKPAPANPEGVAYDLAVCNAALGRHEQAADGFKAFIKQFPTSALAEDAAYRQAFCLHKLTRYAESLAVCEALAEKPAASAPAAELAAENLFLMGRYAEAAPRYAELAKGANDDAARRFAFRLGQCAYFQDDFARAVEHLQPLGADAAVPKDPALREALLLLGDAQLQTGQHAAAAATLGKYVALDTKRRAEAQYKRALAQQRAGQAKEARQQFAEVMKGSADSPWTLRATFQYAQRRHKDGHATEAAELLGKVLAAKPPEDLLAPTNYLLAWIDMEAGRHKPAAERFGQLAARHADHSLAPDATFYRAVCLKEMGSHKEALAGLQAYLASHADGPRADEAREMVGVCLARMGQHKEAAKALSVLAADKDACTDTVLYELAWAHRKLKQPKEAEAPYRRLLTAFPHSPLLANARAELAELLDARKAYAEAAALLEKVAAEKAADAATRSAALYRMGLCYQKLARHAQAGEAFARFAAEFPDDGNTPSALYLAGTCYAADENWADARKHLAALVAKFPKDELDNVAHLRLGEVQAQAGQHDDAAKTYADFLKKYPKDRQAFRARFGLGWAMENTRKYDDARRHYAQVVASHNGPTAARAQFQIGECYFAEGKFDEAVKELLKVEIVYDYPEWSARALYEAGRALEQLGRRDDAKKQYATCVRKYKDSNPAALSAKRLKAMGG